jgi:hypothetical protein
MGQNDKTSRGDGGPGNKGAIGALTPNELSVPQTPEREGRDAFKTRLTRFRNLATG